MKTPPLGAGKMLLFKNMEGAKEEKRKSYDWDELYDGLLEPSGGHKQEDGTLAPEHELEEIRNKVALLTTRAAVQKLRGEEDVDGKVRAGLRILKSGYPHRTNELRGFLDESSNLEKFADVFDDPEK